MNTSPGSSPRIASVGRALPPHRYEQEELVRALEELWARQHYNPRRLARLHEAVQVGGRSLALPLDGYRELSGFGEANDAFVRVGSEIGAAAIQDALARAELRPPDIDAIFFTTVTGLATPTLDARLAVQLGLRPDVRRVPMFGLGCVAGAAGVARMADYLRGRPDHAALLLSVELCSLTLQRGDLSVPNLIATGLFGDGAACAVGLGADRAGPDGPRVLDARSALYPGTERVMGWDIDSSGFRIVLSARVPDVVREHIGPDVDAFLSDHDLLRADIGPWICHPGGPKVLEALQEALGLTRDDLGVTWRSLHEIGNLSSASVLFVLADTLEAASPNGAGRALMLAMGPGFCSELVLLRW